MRERLSVCVCDIREHPRFRFFAYPFSFSFCFVLLYCLYLWIFWEQALQCVYVCIFSYSLISYSVHYNIRFTSVFLSVIIYLYVCVYVCDSYASSSFLVCLFVGFLTKFLLLGSFCICVSSVVSSLYKLFRSLREIPYVAHSNRCAIVWMYEWVFDWFQ